MQILKDLNFKVPAEFHKLFAMVAVERDIFMKDLLVNCFTCWLIHMPDQDAKDFYLNQMRRWQQTQGDSVDLRHLWGRCDPK